MAKFILVCGIRIATEFEAETHGRLRSIGPKFLVGDRGKQVFECDCGEIVVAPVCGVKCGDNVSCGCYKKELTADRSIKHGLYEHPLYSTWEGMIGRCCNRNARSYHLYGGRGVTVCERWRENFANFLRDMGERPKGCTLDRIDNSRGYEPSNCRWATYEEQANNTRSNRVLVFNGKTQTMTQWERELGFPKNLICNRLCRGWTVERALSEPVQEKYRNRAK